MKRILSLVLITGLAFGANAQDKKIRAGLVTGFTVNSLKVQTTKIERNGVGAGFTIGMIGDYNINENIAFSSGIQFDLGSFKVNYGNNNASTLGNVFYGYTDTDIYKYDADNNSFTDFSDTTFFELQTRKFKYKYITIPLFLKFQTNMIGSFRYYGKFGLRTSFLAGIRMDDTGYDAVQTAGNFVRLNSNPRTLENMKPLGLKKGLSPVNMGIGIYGGSEWNFTGNTYLFAEIGFNYGITPVLFQKSGHLVETEETTSSGVYAPTGALDIKNAPMHTFELKIGLLF
ncbi:MAG TPA: hypothetical protein EYG85_07245 [Crocinitomix sp.]|nr:hypothetical protein [Crocinitomix sp.]